MKTKDLYQLSKKLAPLSKDQSTKVAAVFVNNNESFTPFVFGYNGMPRGLNDFCEIKNQRNIDFKWGDNQLMPEKYYWYEHAERNAVFNVARETLKGQTVLNSHYPTMEGARAIVSVGCSRIIILHPEPDSAEKKKVLNLFSECGVVVQEYSDLEGKEKTRFGYYFEFLQQYAQSIAISLVTEQRFSAAFNTQSTSLIESAVGIIQPANILIWNELNPLERKVRFQDSRNLLEPEKMMVINTIKSKFKDKILITNWCPCYHCALFVAALGIKKVITKDIDLNNENELRWKESFDKSLSTFKEHGIKVYLVRDEPS